MAQNCFAILVLIGSPILAEIVIWANLMCLGKRKKWFLDVHLNNRNIYKLLNK